MGFPHGRPLEFPGPKGGPLRYKNFHDRVWVPAGKRDGLEGLGFHYLRRAHRWNARRSGTNLIKNRAAHAGPAVRRDGLQLSKQWSRRGDSNP